MTRQYKVVVTSEATVKRTYFVEAGSPEEAESKTKGSGDAEHECESAEVYLVRDIDVDVRLVNELAAREELRLGGSDDA
jgi:hypothetical protein